MPSFRLAWACSLVVAVTLASMSASADAPAARSVVLQPALHAGPLLTSGLAEGARRLDADRGGRPTSRWSQAPASQASGRPFWTRTKLLVAAGAALLITAWLVAEMKETCRAQGPDCFD